jgi:hypothetical protein
MNHRRSCPCIRTSDLSCSKATGQRVCTCCDTSLPHTWACPPPWWPLRRSRQSTPESNPSRLGTSHRQPHTSPSTTHRHTFHCRSTRRRSKGCRSERRSPPHRRPEHPRCGSNRRHRYPVLRCSPYRHRRFQALRPPRSRLPPPRLRPRFPEHLRRRRSRSERSPAPCPPRRSARTHRSRGHSPTRRHTCPRSTRRGNRREGAKLTKVTPAREGHATTTGSFTCRERSSDALVGSLCEVERAPIV